MIHPTRLFLFFFSVVITHTAFTQTVQFNAEGTVKDFNPIAARNAIQMPAATRDLLVDESKKEKEKVRAVLIEKIRETRHKMEEDEYLKAFLPLVWTDAPGIQSELTKLLTYLESDGDSGTTGITLYKGLIQSIDTTILGRAPSLYQTKRPTDKRLELWKTDPFGRLVIDYYKHAYAAAPSEIRNLNLVRLTRYTEYLATQRKGAADITAAIVKNGNVITGILYEEIDDFLNTLNASASIYTLLKGLIGRDWFKQWFWFQEGQLRLNPLDVTTDGYLQKVPQYDAKKSAIFNEYIDTVLARRIRYDTIGNAEDFKRLLAYQGTGRTQFSLREKIAALQAENAKSIDRLQKVDKLLNRVDIPKEEREFYSLAKNDDFASPLNKDEYLTRPLRGHEYKVILVHNIPAGAKADLEQKNKEIPSRSAFQTGIDSLGSYFAQVAEFAVQLSPYGSLFTAAKAVSSQVIEEPLVPLSPAAGAFSSPKVIQHIEVKLRSKSLFSKRLFDVVRAELGPRVSENDVLFNEDYDETNIRHQKLVLLFLDTYGQRILRRWEDLRQDSLVLSHLDVIFSNSTLPVSELEKKEDKEPLYTTGILRTDKSDKPIEKTVTAYLYKEKDSTKLKTFVYKADRSYRFQVSAGVSYTIPDFVQSKAEEQGGSVAITNKAQHSRFTAGVHIHFGNGLYLQDNRVPGRFLERSSLYLGIGIPRPLENIYAGYSYDFVPGLKAIAGVHFYADNRYTIENNKIVEERRRYEVASPFVALHIDPSGLLKALKLF